MSEILTFISAARKSIEQRFDFLKLELEYVRLVSKQSDMFRDLFMFANWRTYLINALYAVQYKNSNSEITGWLMTLVVPLGFLNVFVKLQTSLRRVRALLRAQQRNLRTGADQSRSFLYSLSHHIPLLIVP